MRRRWAAYWAEAIDPRLVIVSHTQYAGRALVVLRTIVSVAAGLPPVGFVLGISNVIG